MLILGYSLSSHAQVEIKHVEEPYSKYTEHMEQLTQQAKKYRLDLNEKFIYIGTREVEDLEEKSIVYRNYTSPSSSDGYIFIDIRGGYGYQFKIPANLLLQLDQIKKDDYS